MSIDKDTVKHISKLARISLDENKVESLSKDLTSIMKFIESLNKLNTEYIVCFHLKCYFLTYLPIISNVNR